MQAFPQTTSSTWKVTPLFWGGIALCTLILAFTFDNIIRSLIHTWSVQEEYSHGYFIPVISAYLIYQQRDVLKTIPFTGSWFGVCVLAFGGLLSIFGRLAVISTMGQYAFVICLWGCCLSFMGWRAFRVIWPALFMLVFMVELPAFVYNNLSSELQLISSNIGVWVIQLFGISVYHEGNVIDLGVMQLQVVEACNGLRYLFPLMALSMILAIMYKGAMWRKSIIFLSSVPVSILMNSFRIGLIGVTVEYWGQEMAEGILHDFEGWVVFMGALAVIFLEIKLLSLIVGDKRPFSEVLSLEPAKPSVVSEETRGVKANKVPQSLYLTLTLLVGIFLANSMLTVAETEYPERESLASFPLEIEQWQGRVGSIEEQYLNILKLDDYLIADYQSLAGISPINFYVAYYSVQAEGQGTIHSPKSCLPGSGWRIKSINQIDMPEVKVSDTPLRVNRALIAKGDNQTLVYYWLQGRGRVITDEFMAKWWIFWDRMTKGRSDGALIRVLVSLDKYASIEEAEADMQEFVKAAVPRLSSYIPD